MMRKLAILIYSVLIIILSNGLIYAQTAPTLFEAESGTLGGDFSSVDEGGITYITIQTNGVEQFPESAARVSSYTITFDNPGEYDLYAKIRVGSNGADDDSFFYGNGFGTKDVTQADEWQRMNNLASAGFSIDNQYVTGEGSAQSEVWKWINLSEFTGDETPITFLVEDGALTQTFEIGAREDGLDFDKFAFAPSNLYYTVKNLENGEPGVSELPDPNATPPIAEGQSKFIGNVYSNSQRENFASYWNQVTPENAGKWGSVESTRDVMNWAQLDNAYELAKSNNFPFRMHVMIWGNQQPSWIESLTPAEQLTEIKQWFDSVANRYPAIDFVEVVNEPLHDPPNQPGNGGGNYIDALGGSGSSGWDWILESFRLARQYFPNAKLMMNDYNIVNSSSNVQQYINIVELLQAENLIDQIGIQAHAFTVNDISATTLKSNLDQLASTGLPIYVTELDIDGDTDLLQLERYRRVFPVLWEHPSVEGITLWGYRPGMWRTDQMAYLILNDGITERPALEWLRKYVAGEFISVTSIEVSAPSNSVEEDQSLQLTAEVLPNDATFIEVIWSVETQPGSSGSATIDENGLLTATNPGSIKVIASATDGSKLTGEKIIEIKGKTITSLDENDKIGIYPNPINNGRLTVSSSHKLQQLQLLDLNGKVLQSWKGLKQLNMNLEINQQPGIYVLQIENNHAIKSSKIVIQ